MHAAASTRCRSSATCPAAPFRRRSEPPSFHAAPLQSRERVFLAENVIPDDPVRVLLTYPLASPGDALAPCPADAAGPCALGGSVCDHVSIDGGLRSEETVDTCHHSSDVALDRSASYEVEGFLLAEPRSGVRCSARGVTAGHQ